MSVELRRSPGPSNLAELKCQTLRPWYQLKSQFFQLLAVSFHGLLGSFVPAGSGVSQGFKGGGSHQIWGLPSFQDLLLSPATLETPDSIPWQLKPKRLHWSGLENNVRGNAVQTWISLCVIFFLEGLKPLSFLPSSGYSVSFQQLHFRFAQGMYLSSE